MFQRFWAGKCIDICLYNTAILRCKLLVTHWRTMHILLLYIFQYGFKCINVIAIVINVVKGSIHHQGLCVIQYNLQWNTYIFMLLYILTTSSCWNKDKNIEYINFIVSKTQNARVHRENTNKWMALFQSGEPKMNIYAFVHNLLKH